MCGICGVVTRRPRDEIREILAGMNAALVHRGPDDCGSYIDGDFGLAVRRLSVIDVESGHQPIFNEDGSLALVFNGGRRPPVRGGRDRCAEGAEGYVCPVHLRSQQPLALPGA